MTTNEDIVNRLGIKLLYSREEWLANRLTGLGGTAASIVMGINKYKSEEGLIEELKGESVPDKDDLPDKKCINSDTSFDRIDKNLPKG